MNKIKISKMDKTFINLDDSMIGSFSMDVQGLRINKTNAGYVSLKVASQMYIRIDFPDLYNDLSPEDKSKFSAIDLFLQKDSPLRFVELEEIFFIEKDSKYSHVMTDISIHILMSNVYTEEEIDNALEEYIRI